MRGDDQHRILPRYFARQQEIQRQRRIARIVLETGETAPARAIAGVTAGGDERRMRGAPIVARGVRGVIAGTQPEAALLAAERQRERRHG